MKKTKRSLTRDMNHLFHVKTLSSLSLPLSTINHTALLEYTF